MADMDIADWPPPFLVTEPAVQTAALVFASPHSGQDYSAAFLAESRLSPLMLRRSEDYGVDELFAAAPDFGAPLIRATFPRAYCDPNREPWELDPTMFADDLPSWVTTRSARIGAGLGTIPRVVASGEPIYEHKLSFAEAEHRIQTCWQPYHRRLEGLVERTREQFGTCLLVDCHSMPSMPQGMLPDFILGDAHGTSCDRGITAGAEAFLAGLGYHVRRNDPYAGGFVTRHYGRPRQGVHGLQIEVARRLYMDEHRMTSHGGFSRLHRVLTALIAHMTQPDFLTG